MTHLSPANRFVSAAAWLVLAVLVICGVCAIAGCVAVDLGKCAVAQMTENKCD